jgi:hypothetical protein
LNKNKNSKTGYVVCAYTVDYLCHQHVYAKITNFKGNQDTKYQIMPANL